ncbi:hypothetical protein HELRODRAFT_85323 [Helobdella robusta]|uniref:RING-type domain-containing protein n=1 Tax=Helobdella robusta TaxID=6412 RepID=T1G5V4_HELRO|nr:hypothetical protein HELRODRAFT_85323 [Helobdella robusta]ESN97498.1 hypothetical protein HELRODRAFT_85323 [Helobdella robusta]
MCLIDNELLKVEIFHHDSSGLFPSSKKCSKLPYVRNKFLNDTCPICMEQFTETSFVRELKCRHTFHVNCMKYWFKEKTHCPCCRRDFAVTAQLTTCYNHRTLFTKTGKKIISVTLFTGAEIVQ